MTTKVDEHDADIVVSKKRKLSSPDVSETPPDKTVTPPTPPLTRSTEYWFEDGNFLLQARNTQFKVHQSVLAARCEFFRDAFEKCTVPRNSLDPPLMILPSSVEDMELLLAFVYDGLSTWKLCAARYEGGKFPISLVSAMLRMGRNSGFTELRNEGTKLLREFLPSCQNANIHSNHFWLSMPPDPQEMGDIYADIIVLGHEHALLFILISAYWVILSSYSLEGIVHIFSTLPPIQKAKLRLNEPTTTLLGRERIRSWTAQFMMSLTRDKKIPCDQSCKSPKKCVTILNEFTFQTLGSADTSIILKYALCSNRFCQDGDVVDTLCVACKAVYMRERQAAWERLWVDFPSVFGLRDDPTIVWVMDQEN